MNYDQPRAEVADFLPEEVGLPLRAPQRTDSLWRADPLLLKTIRPVGCERLLRATYVDATSSSVTT
ncbi:hypothetical protein ACWD7T_35310, partial [Streptomyces sp. 900116325]